MKLACMFNRTSALADHQRGRTADIDGEYPLTVGAEYAVAGMVIWENVLNLLVRDDLGYPCSAPAGLFEETPQRLPEAWQFSVGPGIRASGPELWVRPWAAVWGYAELVNDPIEHLRSLFDREGHALAIFERRMAEFTVDPGDSHS